MAPVALRRSARLASKRSSKGQHIGKEARPLRVEANARCSKKRDALSSSALEAHNRNTADEPLPSALNQWRNNSNTLPVSEAVPSTRSNTIYDPNLPELLTRQSIFNEILPPDPETPKNLKAIQDAILTVPAGLEGSTEDYSTYCQVIFEPYSGSRACILFFGIPPRLPEFHIRGGGPKWEEIDQPKLDHVPKPDYIEGISSVLLPEWVQERLGSYARPVAGVAFPNFIVEHKDGRSTRVAHTQCRLTGAYAARSYYELHGLYGNPDLALNTALVGTVEFKGDTCVGNIHWVSSPSGGNGGLQYHMKRVLCCFTRGLERQDFIRNRRMARNFRDYFAELRVEHFKKLKDLKPPKRRRLKVSVVMTGT